MKSTFILICLSFASRPIWGEDLTSCTGRSDSKKNITITVSELEGRQAVVIKTDIAGLTHRFLGKRKYSTNFVTYKSKNNQFKLELGFQIAPHGIGSFKFYNESSNFLKCSGKDFTTMLLDNWDGNPGEI